MSRLTRIEQETVINFNAGEEEAVVYTRDKAVIRKLDSLVTELLISIIAMALRSRK